RPRIEQAPQVLQAVGEGTGRELQPVASPIFEQAIGGAAEGKLVEQDRDPHGDTEMAFRDELGRWRGGDHPRPSVAAASGAVAAATIDAAVGADVDLQDFAVVGAGKRGEGQSAVGTALVVVVE